MYRGSNVTQLQIGLFRSMLDLMELVRWRIIPTEIETELRVTGSSRIKKTLYCLNKGLQISITTQASREKRVTATSDRMKRTGNSVSDMPMYC